MKTLKFMIYDGTKLWPVKRMDFNGDRIWVEASKGPVGNIMADSKVLVQNTGFFDMHKIEIFEANILRIKAHDISLNVPVVWSDSEGAFGVICPEDGNPEGKFCALKDYIGFDYCSIQIIGNIFQDSIILTTQKKSNKE